MPVTTKHSRMMTCYGENLPIMPHDRLTLDPREKLKIKYLFFCNAFSYQTWQGGNLWWGKLIHNARWPSDHVILWGQVTNWKLNISSSTRSMTTKYGRLVTYDGCNAPMESHDPLTSSWCVVTWRMVTGSLPWSNMTFWIWSLVRPEKYKT